jgi:transposase
MTRSLQVMRDWLVECGMTVAAMESTSTYWKGAFYCLEEEMEVWLVNAAHIKSISRRKTDVKDAEWIAQLLEVGLIRPSFVPPPDIRRLRMLTRYRVQLMADRTREITRLELMLEDASVKLSSVAASLTSVSARAMLAALISGESDPRVLADLAKGKMRRKIPALTEALTGLSTPSTRSSRTCLAFRHRSTWPPGLESRRARGSRQARGIRSGRCTATSG